MKSEVYLAVSVNLSLQTSHYHHLSQTLPGQHHPPSQHHQIVLLPNLLRPLILVEERLSVMVDI